MSFWIVYFWIIAILVVVSALGRVFLYFRPDQVKFYDIVESVISIAAIAGLHGYVYQSAYLSPFFWQVTWILLLAAWLASLRDQKNGEMINKIGLKKGIAVIAVTAILGFPTLLVLFAYAFLSKSLWND